jgi:V/A-type H+-transporting ATPase subunit E
MGSELARADERIQVICEKIRVETVKPAQEQAHEIIEQAKKEAERIRNRAREEMERAEREFREHLEGEKRIFYASLEQGGRQAFALLKQKIERALFNPALSTWVRSELGGIDSQVTLIQVLIEAIRKEGTQTDLAVTVADHFSVSEINAKLGASILATLKDHSVELGDIGGGARVRLVDDKMVIDVSDKVLEEVVASFIRRDFRQLLFAPTKS